MDVLLRQCARSYLDLYHKIKIRDISYEIRREAGLVGSGRDRIAFLVKTLTMPSPDEIPLLHALGLLADEAHKRGMSVEIYEYEPSTGPLDRYSELKRLTQWLLATGMPMLIAVPSVLQVALVEVADEDGVLEPVGTVRVMRDLYFYLPTPELGNVRFLVKTNSRASFKKYQLMRKIAIETGLRVWKERLFHSNREILDYLVKEAVSSGPRGLAVNVPVTRLSLAVISVLHCTGDDDLIREQIVEGGEDEEFVLISHGLEGWMLDALEDALDRIVEAYQASNTYPKEKPETSLMEEVVRHMGSSAVSEVKRLYEALSVYKST